ncbi:MAG: ComF family protein [Cyclonatronaceae bacterium]
MIQQCYRILEDLSGLLYPVTCLVCGDRLGDDAYLCGYCMDHAFPESGEEGWESGSGMVLPEWIATQVALWEFDKGGYLQDVLHHLKYSGLADLGRLLGERLGYKLMRNRFMTVSGGTVLLPVPLHPARQRKRGYNQSALIANGIAVVTGAQTAANGAVVRVSNTRTQTGLSAADRKENLKGVFQVRDAKTFRGRDVIIVDDVITTGATAFELARQISPSALKTGVATIARA